jgi:carboxyl-terminal processing protease
MVHWRRLIGTVSGILCLLVVASVPPAAANDREKSDEYYELMRTFVETFDEIERNYVTDVDRRQLLEAAIKGMLSELDQYSSYIGSKDLERFNQSVEQEFGGIGIQVTVDDKSKRLTVMTPLPGTPAYREGVKAGDVIVEIEGKSTDGFGVEDAVRAIKGPAGEAVTIGVRRAGTDKVEQITIVREIIQVATCLGDRYTDDDQWDFMLDDEHKIGYIRLTHFSRRTAGELREAIDDLKDRGMKGLVLDLRFNPGGLLQQATEIADLFIEKGTIVSTKGRNTEPRVWEAKKEGTYGDFPMVVLVNRFSASASEIVSAALQDHERAIVVGERTWGKGSVQNVREIDGGQGALKLTTASYHRPSGKNIHKFPDANDSDEWGVSPDDGFEVKFSTDDVQKYLEYRRERDVIGGNGASDSDYKDPQLAKAVEHLLEKLGGGEAKEKAGGKAEAEKPKAGRDEEAEDDEAAARERRELIVPQRAAA